MKKALQKKNLSAAHDVKNDPPKEGRNKKDEQDFLEIIKLMNKRLDQTLDKMDQRMGQIEAQQKGPNNNNLIPQVWSQRF